MNTLICEVEAIFNEIEAETDEGYTLHSAIQLIRRDRAQLARHKVVTRDNIEYCQRCDPRNGPVHWPCLDAATVIAYWLNKDINEVMP